MIPILFREHETTFDNQGIGALAETISCLVTEERNGIYELEMTYPINGKLYNELQNGRIIYTTHEYGKPADAFRIYSITRPLNGIVNIKAEHISYQLDNIPLSPFTSTSAQDCIAKIPEHIEEDNPFTITTNIDRNYTWHLKYPISVRGAFGGWQGSIIDAYGGELQWDLWNVSLLKERGKNRGFTIRYGVNLVDVKQEENIANVITSIYPYYYSPALTSGDSDVLVTLPEKILDSEHTHDYPFRRTAVYDFTYRFTETPSVEELRAVANQYINYDYVGIPVVSLTVKFSQLSKAKEYELLKDMETVQLCDTVNVVFEKLNINTTAKVTRIIWDSLKDQYESVTVGDVRSNLSRILQMNKQNNENNVYKTYSAITNNSEYVTNVLTGSTGGHMVTLFNSEGKPEQQLFMDTDDVTTARKVLRINKDGWGFSKNGINGPYTLAAVLDDEDAAGGHIVADLITTGMLQSPNGLYSLNMETGEVVMKSASITGGDIDIETSSSTSNKIRLIYPENSTRTKSSTIYPDKIVVGLEDVDDVSRKVVIDSLGTVEIYYGETLMARHGYGFSTWLNIPDDYSGNTCYSVANKNGFTFIDNSGNRITYSPVLVASW